MTEEQLNEFKVKLNTEEGTEVWESPIIKGKLDCFIIDSMNKVSITIESSLGYTILHNAEHFGIEYYAPRAILRGWKKFHFDIDSYDKFNLNESIIIRVSGSKNSNVTIRTRWI